jgi:hypothetical protein
MKMVLSWSEVFDKYQWSFKFETLHFEEDWAAFLAVEFLEVISSLTITSTILYGQHQNWGVSHKDNFCWKVGTCHSNNFWYDSWCGEPLAQSLNIHQNVVNGLPQLLSDIILNQHWVIPPESFVCLYWEHKFEVSLQSWTLWGHEGYWNSCW